MQSRKKCLGLCVRQRGSEAAGGSAWGRLETERGPLRGASCPETGRPGQLLRLQGRADSSTRRDMLWTWGMRRGGGVSMLSEGATAGERRGGGVLHPHPL